MKNILLIFKIICTFFAVITILVITGLFIRLLVAGITYYLFGFV